MRNPVTSIYHCQKPPSCTLKSPSFLCHALSAHVKSPCSISWWLQSNFVSRKSCLKPFALWVLIRLKGPQLAFRQSSATKLCRACRMTCFLLKKGGGLDFRRNLQNRVFRSCWDIVGGTVKQWGLSWWWEEWQLHWTSRSDALRRHHRRSSLTNKVSHSHF